MKMNLINANFKQIHKLYLDICNKVSKYILMNHFFLDLHLLQYLYCHGQVLHALRLVEQANCFISFTTPISAHCSHLLEIFHSHFTGMVG